MSINNNEFLERLELVRKKTGITQKKLGELAGISATTISRWKRPGASPPDPKSIKAVSSVIGCDLIWLATGRGEPFPGVIQRAKIVAKKLARQGVPISTGLSVQRHGDNLEQDGDTSSKLADSVPVTYIEDTYASAGGGVINYETARRVMTFDRGFLSAQLGIHQFSNIHVIHAVGDSMEPTIHPGDMLFVNPGEKEIVTGAVYVFLIGEETMVKRIERNPITEELVLRSDNDLYEPVRIDKDNLGKVQVIGRVMGNFRKF